MERDVSMLPILMYHGVHDDASAHGHFDPVYSVRRDQFARQLDWLLQHGRVATRLDAGDPATVDSTRNRKQVVISFDDGDISNFEVALPLLLERGMQAEFFISSNFIDKPGMVATGDVRRLADSGMGIGSHGRSHAFLDDLAPTALHAELSDSRERLRDIVGRDVSALALPGGRGGQRELRAAQALGYRHVLGSVPGPNRNPRPGRCLQRVAVTRATTMAQFAALVSWQGITPRVTRARFTALSLPKFVLGNRGYQRMRARLL